MARVAASSASSSSSAAIAQSVTTIAIVVASCGAIMPEPLHRPAIVHGTRDMIVPVGAGQWLWQHLPNANLHELPQAAHMPFYSHRAEFVAALEELRG